MLKTNVQRLTEAMLHIEALEAENRKLHAAIHRLTTFAIPAYPIGGEPTCAHCDSLWVDYIKRETCP